MSRCSISLHTSWLKMFVFAIKSSKSLIYSSFFFWFLQEMGSKLTIFIHCINRRWNYNSALERPQGVIPAGKTGSKIRQTVLFSSLMWLSRLAFLFCARVGRFSGTALSELEGTLPCKHCTEYSSNNVFLAFFNFQLFQFRMFWSQSTIEIRLFVAINAQITL